MHKMQLPTALPDEILFSRYVRHMTILGMNAPEYLKTLLKRPRASVHPYLTIGINEAAQICEDSVSNIYRYQTLGGLFAFFSPKNAKPISEALLQNNGSKAIRSCQLVSFKEKEVLSLKYCSVCARQDIWHFGVSYWHRLHQVSGVEACPDHKVWLIHQELPGRPHLRPLLMPPYSDEPENCNEISAQFAKFTKEILDEISDSNKFFSRSKLLENLSERGYILDSRRFKRKELTSDLFTFIQGLDRIPPDLLPYSDTDYRYLSYLLSGNVCQHPFKYLLVLFWLTKTTYGNLKSQQETLKIESNQCEEDQSEICKYLLKHGESLAEISRVTGKSRCYLKALAIKNNIPIKLKPRFITKELISAVLVMANKGFHRKAIANKFQISTGSVEQIISTINGLVEKRRRFKFESTRRRYKGLILRDLRNNPLAIKQEVKERCYAAFHWMYSHEKAWLKQTLPVATKPKVPPRVDWELRDIELASKVKSILLKPNGKMTFTKLDEALGGHGWLTRMRHKLPHTMAVFRKFYP
jgi:hypothetical protein